MASHLSARLTPVRPKWSAKLRASETRQRILEASSRLFSSRGFTNTTVRDIGREARVTDAAIYYHFRAKHDLLNELVNSELRIDSTFERLFPASPLPFPELIQRIVECSLRLVEEHADLLRIVLREGLSGEPAARSRYREVMDSWEQHVAEAISQSAVLPPIAGANPQTLAREIVYTVAMGIEDTLLFQRDRRASAHDRGVGLRRFLARALTKFSWAVGTALR